jgi:hypothetical protein
LVYTQTGMELWEDVLEPGSIKDRRRLLGAVLVGPVTQICGRPWQVR